MIPMNKYIELLYYYTIKKNTIILKKLGRNIDDKKFALFVVIVAVLSAIIGWYLNMSLKSMVIFVILYVGAALSLPSILYENKIETLESNIPQALYIMILALESGRSVNEALEEVVKSNIKDTIKLYMITGFELKIKLISMVVMWYFCTVR